MPEQENELSESILEIRFKANPKILDYRGTWAEMIKTTMSFAHWKVTGDRIDLNDDNYERHVFVSYKNFGITIKNSPTKNYFPDQGNKLIRFLYDQESFGNSIFVNRIGIRSRFAIRYGGEFPDLLASYLKNFIQIDGDIKAAYNGSVIDFGCNLTFKTEKGFINTTCGPMKNDQIAEFFPDYLNFPEVALYIDIDYWKKPDTEFKRYDLSKYVSELAAENWNIKEKLVAKLCSVPV